MNRSAKDFEVMSRTGRKILILKFIKKCECATKDMDVTDFKKVETLKPDLAAAFGNQVKNDNKLKVFNNVTMKTYCKKCFGLGSYYNPMITDKLRYDSDQVAGIKKAEGASNKSTEFYDKNEALTFFLPSFMNTVSVNDNICTLIHDSDNVALSPYKIDDVFRVIDVSQHFDGEFTYNRITTRRINSNELKNIEVKQYVLGTSS